MVIEYAWMAEHGESSSGPYVSKEEAVLQAILECPDEAAVGSVICVGPIERLAPEDYFNLEHIMETAEDSVADNFFPFDDASLALKPGAEEAFYEWVRKYVYVPEARWRMKDDYERITITQEHMDRALTITQVSLRAEKLKSNGKADNPVEIAMRQSNNLDSPELPELSEEELGLIQAIELTTDYGVVLFTDGLKYTYFDKNCERRERRITYDTNHRLAERRLLALRKALLYARQDHIPPETAAIE